MKKILLAIAATIAISTSALAEVNYNFKNPEHKADKECIAVLSIARDALFNEVDVKDGMVWIRTIEPTAEVVKARNTITDMQNKLLLKYAPGGMLMTHVDVYKMYVKQQGTFEQEFNKCIGK